MTVQAPFAEEATDLQERNHGFLAMLGYHGHLDLAALYVKDGVRRISLREQDPIFLAVDDRFARADLDKKAAESNPFRPITPPWTRGNRNYIERGSSARASRCFPSCRMDAKPARASRPPDSRDMRAPRTSPTIKSRRICELLQRTDVGEVPTRGTKISTDEVKK